MLLRMLAKDLGIIYGNSIQELIDLNKKINLMVGCK